MATWLYDSGIYAAHADAAAKRIPFGFIYVITHPAFPGYVKIGRTERHPEDRLRDYQTYCPYGAFTLEYFIYTNYRDAVERWVHEALGHKRCNGEWFACSVAEARSVLEPFDTVYLPEEYV